MTRSPCFRPASPSFHAIVSVLLLLLLALSIGACQAGSAPAGSEASEQGADGARAVVVTVDSVLRVDEVDRAVTSVRELVSRHDGVVAFARVDGSSSDPAARFEARVPASRAESFRTELRKLGEVDEESERLEDVTAPRSDLEARLRNARAHEKRLLMLLDDRAATLTDVVAVEKEVASIRESIERLEAEKRLMDARIAFTTVNISLQPKYVQPWARPGQSIVSAFTAGLRAARTLVVGGAVVAAASLPPVLVLTFAVLLLIGFLKGLQRWRSRRTLAERRG